MNVIDDIIKIEEAVDKLDLIAEWACEIINEHALEDKDSKQKLSIAVNILCDYIYILREELRNFTGMYS